MAEVQTQQALIEAHALARHVRMSPQKARLVMDLIRGQKAQDALQTLKYTPKRAAKHIEKVLRSAIANAERKAEDSGAPLDVDMLFVAQCFVNEGPRWKRLRPAPMGRAFRYQKRTAHLWVGVAEHHVAAAERVAANVAEAEAQKGVRGTARRVRKALTGKQAPSKRARSSRPSYGRARSKENHGTEDAPVRIPARLQQTVEVAVVCRQGLRRSSSRRRQAPQRAEGKTEERGASARSKSNARRTSWSCAFTRRGRASSSGARARRSTS